MHVTTMSSLTQPRTATCMRCDTFAICLLMLLHARAAVKPLTPKPCQTAVAGVARPRGCVSVEPPSRLGGVPPLGWSPGCSLFDSTSTNTTIIDHYPSLVGERAWMAIELAWLGTNRSVNAHVALASPSHASASS